MKDDPENVGDDYGDYDDEDAPFYDDDIPNDGDVGMSMVNLEPRHCPLTDMDWGIFQEMVLPVELALPRSQLKQAWIDAKVVVHAMMEDY